eukprot:5371894-Amphidinium_carterae.2
MQTLQAAAEASELRALPVLVPANDKQSLNLAEFQDQVSRRIKNTHTHTASGLLWSTSGAPACTNWVEPYLVLNHCLLGSVA